MTGATRCCCYNGVYRGGSKVKSVAFFRVTQRLCVAWRTPTRVTMDAVSDIRSKITVTVRFKHATKEQQDYDCVRRAAYDSHTTAVRRSVIRFALSRGVNSAKRVTASIRHAVVVVVPRSTHRQSHTVRRPQDNSTRSASFAQSAWKKM